MNGVTHRQNGSGRWHKIEEVESKRDSPDMAAGGEHLLKDVLKLAVCTVGGVVFGFAAEKGRGEQVCK